MKKGKNISSHFQIKGDFCKREYNSAYNSINSQYLPMPRKRREIDNRGGTYACQYLRQEKGSNESEQAYSILRNETKPN